MEDLLRNLIDATFDTGYYQATMEWKVLLSDSQHEEHVALNKAAIERRTSLKKQIINLYLGDDERTHVCVFVELSGDNEPLCPQCSAHLGAMIHTSDEEGVALRWHPEDNCWEYFSDGGDTCIEYFACPSCGWSAPYVEPRGEE